MELDLMDVAVDLSSFTPRELEEVLEDPFSVRLIPDHERADGEHRYYLLGRTVGDRYLFLCYRTDGKKARIFAAREMTEPEQRYYERRYAEFK